MKAEEEPAVCRNYWLCVSFTQFAISVSHIVVASSALVRNSDVVLDGNVRAFIICACVASALIIVFCLPIWSAEYRVSYFYPKLFSSKIEGRGARSPTNPLRNYVDVVV